MDQPATGTGRSHPAPNPPSGPDAPNPSPRADASPAKPFKRPQLCELCHNARPVLKRPKTSQSVCKACFFLVFETEIHRTIVDNALFPRGQRVAIAASGGKDSTVLAHVMKTLNERYDYGLDLVLLSVDEGITGYRDDSLETVKRNQMQYELPLLIVSYEELYGWSMDAIVEQIGKKNNCTFCGVFRRQALDRGAARLKVEHIVTGHNADDIAETVLMNLFRGDVARLQRCTAITTTSDTDASQIPRSKPFKYTYEKEIVLYAYHKKLDYFSTECIYSPQAYRGYARTFLKDLERIRSSAIMDIIFSGEAYELKESAVARLKPQGNCERCGFVASNRVCKACVLLEGLNKGRPLVAIGQRETKEVEVEGEVEGVEGSRAALEGATLGAKADALPAAPGAASDKVRTGINLDDW